MQRLIIRVTHVKRLEVYHVQHAKSFHVAIATGMLGVIFATNPARAENHPARAENPVVHTTRTTA